jgi:hypothetical protein
MSDTEERRTVIGGRHGSPTVTIAFPFSNMVNVDRELRDVVAELASLVARLAEQATGPDTEELAAVRVAAEELAERLSQGG